MFCSISHLSDILWPIMKKIKILDKLNTASICLTDKEMLLKMAFLQMFLQSWFSINN